MTMAGRRDRLHHLRGSRIAIAILVGILIGCICTVLFPDGFFNSGSSFTVNEQRLSQSTTSKVGQASCESSERVKMLKSDFALISEKNAELRKQVRELTEKVRLAEQDTENTRKQVLVLGTEIKAGSFGTVKSLRTNPTVVSDESFNPRLAKLLEKVAVNNEIIVVLANSNVKPMLEVQIASVKRVGIQNYLVVALDDSIENFCKSNGVAYYTSGGNHTVSGLKFRVLREFLQLGYGVLLSNVDIVFLQNPFGHLYRDSDVETTSDGHDNSTAYGFNNGFDEPSMGWARYAHTMRIWVFNSGFFYLRPTLPSIEPPNPGEWYGVMSDVLSELFNYSGSSRSTTTVPVKKLPRKQSNPKHCSVETPPPPPQRPKFATEKRETKRRRVVEEEDDGVEEEEEEEGEKDLVGFSRSEVTVIDTSFKIWKAEKVVFRRRNVWKVRDKKGNSRGAVSSKKKKKTIKMKIKKKKKRKCDVDGGETGRKSKKMKLSRSVSDNSPHYSSEDLRDDPQSSNANRTLLRRLPSKPRSVLHTSKKNSEPKARGHRSLV